jgi:hypothetical protein
MTKTKIINIPMPKQSTHQIVVDQEFDPTILTGYVFRKMGKQLVVYSHNGVVSPNKCGSINVALGKPINAKRKHNCTPDDYTSKSWRNSTTKVSTQYTDTSYQSISLVSKVKDLFKTLLR